MNVQPTTDIDYRQAETVLVKYLATKEMGIKHCREWARWTYGETPFWSVWGLVYGRGDTIFTDICGIHVYDDGRVVIVAKNDMVNLEGV